MFGVCFVLFFIIFFFFTITAVAVAAIAFYSPTDFVSVEARKSCILISIGRLVICNGTAARSRCRHYYYYYYCCFIIVFFSHFFFLCFILFWFSLFGLAFMAHSPYINFDSYNLFICLPFQNSPFHFFWIEWLLNHPCFYVWDLFSKKKKKLRSHNSAFNAFAALLVSRKMGKTPKSTMEKWKCIQNARHK